MKTLYYFDLILEQLDKHNEAISAVFGKHVHWGYWPSPLNSDYGEFCTAAENLSREICSIANIKENDNVLDVGCGFGGTISLLNESFNHLNLLGLNIDERQLSLAKRTIIEKKQNKIDFIEADACNMEHLSQKFDHILAVECIFHFKSRLKFFENALTKLNTGGSITISDFVISPLFVPGCKLLELFPSNLFCPMNFITLNQYHQLASKLNLKIEAYDITKNTLPTCAFLKALLPEFNLSAFQRWGGKRLFNFLYNISSLELSRYMILKFTKL